MKAALLVLSLVVAAFGGLAPLIPTTKDKIEGSYIVVYYENTTKEQLQAELSNVRSVQNVQVQYAYKTVIKGFAAKLDSKQLAAIRLNPLVKYVSEDGEVHIADEQQGCDTQPGLPTGLWGLNRISKRTWEEPAGIYNYPSNAGTGVTSYIIDTGIRLTHVDLGGRATWGYTSDSNWNDADGNGHGTHVASTVAGSTYGVAKNADLIAVKVLSDAGSGTWAGVISGIEWSTEHRAANNLRGTANMSLGGGYQAAVNEAASYASRNGLYTVVAAGNSNADACNFSPASADEVISVGATDNQDARSFFSNYGSCVHILAPGSNVLGAWSTTDTATNTISGTSMASPHICGIATLLHGDLDIEDFIELRNLIVNTATNDAITLNCGNAACFETPNKLGYNDC